MWWDECHSLKTVDSSSYRQIVQGQLEREANNSPLFYGTQKFLCRLIACDSRFFEIIRDPKKESPWNISWNSPFLNTYLRLISFFLMALAPAALFYYFSLFYSPWWGAYASLLCLSSWFFWHHGLEARPYIHFFTLTTLQMLIIVELATAKAKSEKVWLFFGLVNLLLALTFTTSAFQIAAASLYFLCFCRNNLNIWKLTGVFIFPLLVTFYYYAMALKERYWFSKSLSNYFLESVPFEILVVMGLFLLYAIFSWIQLKHRMFSTALIRWLDTKELKTWGGVFSLIVLIFLTYSFVMIFLKVQGLPVQQGGKNFYYRYLIGLVPVGIVGMALFSRKLILSMQQLWMRYCFTFLLVSIVICRLVYVYNKEHSWVGL